MVIFECMQMMGGNEIRTGESAAAGRGTCGGSLARLTRLTTSVRSDPNSEFFEG